MKKYAVAYSQAAREGLKGIHSYIALEPKERISARNIVIKIIITDQRP